MVRLVRTDTVMGVQLMLQGKLIDKDADTAFEIYDDDTILIRDQQEDAVVIPVEHLRFLVQQADLYKEFA